MHRPLLLVPVLVASLLLGTASAQVFIPDLNEREWLNTEIPGIVDANGIMDTLHPGIAGLDSSLFLLYSLPPTVDVHGMQYLDSLAYLRFFTYGQMAPATAPSTITVQGLPSRLRWLEFGFDNPYATDVHFPQLPEEMDMVYAWGMVNWTTRLHFAGMPAELTHLRLDALDSLDWQGPCHAQLMEMHGIGTYDLGSLHVPAIEADAVYLSNVTMTSAPDLSQIITEELHISSSTFYGPLLWPQGVQDLWLQQSNFLSEMGVLPGTLQLFSSNMSVISCAPYLPDGLTEVYAADGSFPSCLRNWPTNLNSISIGNGNWTRETAEYCSVFNSPCPSVAPGISGRLFIDENVNGSYDDGEPPLPYGGVVVQPGGGVAPIASDGTWQLVVPPGNYTITPTGYPYIASVSPAQHAAVLPSTGLADTLNDFAVTLLSDVEDLRVQLVAEPARPGFNNRLYLICANTGSVPMDAQLTLEHDADQTWVGSSIVPGTHVANTATWDLPGLAIGGSQTITVDLNTPMTMTIGTVLTHTLTATPVIGDERPDDNVVVLPDTVVGSFDPNDKLLEPSRMTPEEVQMSGIAISYTIRFQNTGTWLAERVIVLDTLPPGLQRESFQFLCSSHACTWALNSGVLRVEFDDIDLPDSWSDEPGSHGFIRFSILPETGLAEGAEVVNIAHIVFDFNEPIVTPPAVFSVDATQGISEQAEEQVRVYPNPVHDRLWIAVASGARKPVSYSVQDLFGRMVMTGRTVSDAGVEVGHLRAGVYVLMVPSQDSVHSIRFVKQ